jgi:myo-inositol-1-phosphate synthase
VPVRADAADPTISGRSPAVPGRRRRSDGGRSRQRRFEQAGVPIIGDDIKSQVGATITQRVLTTLVRQRGVRLDRTMQLNVGGNSDFLNMLERERLESKISKTNAVTSMLDYDLGAENVHVGPSDYVPWLTDRKWAYIRMEGSSFGDVPLN